MKIFHYQCLYTHYFEGGLKIFFTLSRIAQFKFALSNCSKSSDSKGPSLLLYQLSRRFLKRGWVRAFLFCFERLSKRMSASNKSQD